MSCKPGRVERKGNKAILLCVGWMSHSVGCGTILVERLKKTKRKKEERQVAYAAHRQVCCRASSVLHTIYRHVQSGPVSFAVIFVHIGILLDDL